MTRVEFLLEVKENLTNQLSCISDSFISNIPNERFREGIIAKRCNREES